MLALLQQLDSSAFSPYEGRAYHVHPVAHGLATIILTLSAVADAALHAIESTEDGHYWSWLSDSRIVAACRRRFGEGSDSFRDNGSLFCRDTYDHAVSESCVHYLGAEFNTDVEFNKRSSLRWWVGE